VSRSRFNRLLPGNSGAPKVSDTDRRLVKGKVAAW